MDAGETLRHSASPPGADPTWRMPLGGLAEGFLAAHSSAPRAWLAAALAALVVLSFTLGMLLGGTPGGLFAAAGALLEWAHHPPGPDGLKMFGYSILFLLTATVLAWRARKPGSLRSAALGAVLGCGLLYRSALFALAPALVALEVLLARRGSPRREPRQAALLLLLPALLLLPWIGMNARLHGEFVPFERGAASLNLVTALSGVDAASDGDLRLLMDSPPSTGTQGVLVWALRRAMARPGEFLAGSLRRVSRMLFSNAWLAVAALTLALLRRRRPGLADCSLLSVVYLLVVCSMSVSAYYFQPFWLLLAALLGGAMGPEPGEPSPLALAPAAMILLFVLCGTVGAATMVVRYAARASRVSPASRAAAEAALAGDPDDPWLLLLRGRHAAAAGDARSALKDYGRASARWPAQPRLRLERDWAAHLLGRDDALLGPDPAPAPGEDVRLERHLARALALSVRGRRSAAHGELAAALELWRAAQKVPQAHSSAEREALRLFREGAEGSFYYVAADAVALRGGAGAMDELSGLADASQEPELYRRFALRLQERGEFATALLRFERLAALRPDSAGILKDLGVCAFLAGRRARSIEALRRATSLDPGLREAVQSLEAALAGGEPKTR